MHYAYISSILFLFLAFPAAPAMAQQPAACDASGTWQASTDGVGSASWQLKPTAPGRYSAQERGLGNASGTATVSGTRLRIDWTTGGYAGNYEWDLGVACSGGAGRLEFKSGGSGTHNSRIVREGPPPPPATTASAPPACDAAGTWRASTDAVGSASWTFDTIGPGRYNARERGLGNATGTATVSGSRLRIDWTTGGYAGHYEWDLDAACRGGAGRLVFTQGGSGTHNSRIERETPPPPVVTEGHVPPPPGGRSYFKPQMAGAIVDHCVTWATNCGQAGADQFCRTQGHQRATSFQTFAAGRTYVIGSKQICEASYCVGFAQVTCAGTR